MSAEKSAKARKRPRVSLRQFRQTATNGIGSYGSFTKEVTSLVWSERRLFGKLVAVFVIVSFVVTGLVPQQDYRMVSDELTGATGGGPLDTVILYGGMVTGSIGMEVSGLAPQYGLFLMGVLWLVTVWLVRQRLLGSPVQVRDGLYSGLAPLITTALLVGLAVVQLLPFAIGALLLSAGISSGLLQGMLAPAFFAVVVAGLASVSVYWLSATVISLIVATLPGTYPMAAHKLARSIVSGRRLTVIGRIAWLAGLVFALSVMLLVPAILLDSLIRSEQLPLVPVMLQVVTGISVVFAATYVYMLYRKMIDEESTA